MTTNISAASSLTRSVSFNKNVIIHHCYVSPIQDVNVTYYVKKDYERIAKDNEATLKRMMKVKGGLSKSSRLSSSSSRSISDDSSDNDDETAAEDLFCTRGLEVRTKLGSRKRKMNRTRALLVVLEEQQRQHDDKGYIYNFDIIAEAYCGFSKPCQSQANRIAKQDERIAKEVCDEEQQQQLHGGLNLIIQNIDKAAKHKRSNTRRLSTASNSTESTADSSTISSFSSSSTTTSSNYSGEAI